MNVTKTMLYSFEGDKDDDEKILEPYNYLQKTSGENITDKLSKALNYWLNIPEDKRKQIADIVHIVEDSSLLVDDIEDNSVLRRGVPVAHSIFGIGTTINSACYAIFIALEKCYLLGHPDASWIFTTHLLNMCRGQGIEMYWREHFTCPNEEDYRKMTLQKTGVLFSMTAILMQLFSEDKQDYVRLMEILGLYFQIGNDFINLSSKDYMNEKGYCEDITEGKFSFPIIHAILKNPDDDQVIKILKQKTTNKEIKKYCVMLLEKFGSLEYTQKKMAELHREAKEEIKRLGGNPHLDNFIDYYQNKMKQN